MPRFKFRLETLLRLREQVRDQRREELGKALHADAILMEREESTQARLDALKHEYRAAAGVGEVLVERLLDNQRCEVALRVELRDVQQQRRVVAEEIEKRRAALVEADRQVHVLEKLKEKQYQRFRFEEQRRDLKQMDEIAGRSRLEVGV